MELPRIRNYIEGKTSSLKARSAVHRREDSRAEDDRQYDDENDE